ncbi:MAG: 4'-phosphopantetheinyl transferase superfamily protein [Chloroflexi bacterium]|nr:4'-phosphopantetheinyl transferase superfamily protein [Chloroflexota bacterium]
MIHWLTQSHTELPDPSRLIDEGGYLSEAEYEKFLQLKMEKRRNDWLLGRWTAKRLLQTVIWEKQGITLPLDMITIGNNADGVPNYQLPIDNCQLSISLSHSHGRAFVVAIDKLNVPVGADMEQIEPRQEEFIDDYFTETEAILVRQVEDGARDMMVTAVWSAKEAVLKALHLGLSVDTRAVRCLMEPETRPPKTWTRYIIRYNQEWLPRPAPPLTGWWQVEDGFVLTLAVS